MLAPDGHMRVCHHLASVLREEGLPIALNWAVVHAAVIMGQLKVALELARGHTVGISFGAWWHRTGDVDVVMIDFVDTRMNLGIFSLLTESPATFSGIIVAERDDDDDEDDSGTDLSSTYFDTYAAAAECLASNWGL